MECSFNVNITALKGIQDTKPDRQEKNPTKQNKKDKTRQNKTTSTN